MHSLTISLKFNVICVFFVIVRSYSVMCSQSNDATQKSLFSSFSIQDQNVTSMKPSSLDTRTTKTVRTYHSSIIEKLKGEQSCTGPNVKCDKKTVIESQLKKEVQELNTCGDRTFYISRSQMSVTNMNKFCCGLNLEPAEVQSRNEYDCIRSYYNNRTKSVGQDGSAYIAYWDTTFTRQFETCLTRRAMPNELWASGQPDNNDGTEIRVSLRMCGNCLKKPAGAEDVTYLWPRHVLCQKSNQANIILTTLAPITTSLTTKIKKAAVPYMTFVQQGVIVSGKRDCAKEKCRNNFIVNVDTALLNKRMQLIGTCNNRTYYLTRNVVDISDKTNECCNFNMWSAEFESKDEFNCVRGYFNNFPGRGENVFAFTAYWDTTLTRKFESCSTRKVIPDDIWIEGQPDNKGGVELCAIAHLCAHCSTPGMNDVMCTKPYHVLCYKNGTAYEYKEETTTSTMKPIRKKYDQSSILGMGIMGVFNCTGKAVKCAKINSTQEELEKDMKELANCGKKIFYMSKFNIIAHDEFYQACCKHNLEPGEIGTKSELDCLSNAFNELKGAEKNASIYTAFWDTTFSHKFESCHTRHVLASNLWAPGEHNNSGGTNYCTTVGTSGVSDASCTELRPMLCHKLVSSQKKTNGTKTTKFYYNALVLQGLLLQNIEDCKGRDAVCTKKNVTDEILTKNMQNLGKCGGKTLYYTRNVTKRSYHACCNFNLEPAEIQSKKELNCITQHFSKIPGGGADIKLYTAYWDATFTRKFESCLTRRTLPDELWSKGEPNNKLNVEYCAVLRPCASCEYAGFDDVECTEMLPMLCQMNSGDVIQEETSLLEQTTTTIEITTQFASTSVSNATSVKIVNRYGAPYSTVSKSIMTTFIGCNKKMESCKVPKKVPTEKAEFLKQLNSSNLLFLNECAGKLFFISKDKVQSSWMDCCKSGLVPAEITSVEQFDCVRKSANNVTGLKSDVSAFLAYSDVSLQRKFVSCLSNATILDELWIPGEPDNAGGMDACVLLNLCSSCSKPGFSDSSCSRNERSLCFNRD